MVIHANTTFQGTSHKRQVNVVLGNLVHMHYPSEVYALARTTMLLLPMRCMEPLRWQCGVTSRYVFWLSFFKVLSLTHLTLLLLDFEIAEMIPLAKRRHAGPRKECVWEECSQARESIHIKWTDLRIERVHADGLIPWWFRYVSDWRTICDCKTCWTKFHYLFTLFLLFLMYN
jgi:hypothetical protein